MKFIMLDADFRKSIYNCENLYYKNLQRNKDFWIYADTDIRVSVSTNIQIPLWKCISKYMLFLRVFKGGADIWKSVSIDIWISAYTNIQISL